MAKQKSKEIEDEILEEAIEAKEEKVCGEDCPLKIELARLEKLHSDQVELGINPDAKLEVLITNLRTEVNKL